MIILYNGTFTNEGTYNSNLIFNYSYGYTNNKNKNLNIEIPYQFNITKQEKLDNILRFYCEEEGTITLNVNDSSNFIPINEIVSSTMFYRKNNDEFINYINGTTIQCNSGDKIDFQYRAYNGEFYYPGTTEVWDRMLYI